MSNKPAARMNALNLGELQRDVEVATRSLKKCRTAAERANAALADAEENYMQSQRAAVNGMNLLRAQTKMAV